MSLQPPPERSELRYSVGGGTVVEPQPDERAFPVRQNDFLTLCEGETSKSDQEWRNIWIAIFVTALVGALCLWPTFDWNVALLQKHYAPCVSTLILCSLTFVSLVLSLFFVGRCRKKARPSAYSRLKKRMEDFFHQPRGEEATVTSPLPPQPGTQSPVPAPPYASPQRRTLSIVGKRGRITWLNDEGGGLYEPEQNGKHKAVIAEFRNEPGEFSIINWHHVRASIAYYDEHGSEVADVGRATWLEPAGLKIDMPSHVTCKLVIAVLADKWLSFDGNNALPIPMNTKRARIILQDDRELSLSFNLDVDLHLGEVGPLTLLASQ